MESDLGLSDKKVNPLSHKTVGDIRGSFFVPAYQRGYRWDKDNVTRLLDDIWASDGNGYSLQPIVVQLHKQGETDADCEWELIDGQQRLTTLYLILHYMQKREWRKMGAPYSIRYETRPDSQNYLITLDPTQRQKNIDFYHLFNAYECIDLWFKGRGDAYAQEDVANTLYQYLFKSVRIIWYLAPLDTLSTELFTRLNVGRIPLTDAELVKAALLTAIRKNAPDRTHEIAAQWDSIERDLHNEDIWSFISGHVFDQTDDLYPTRISLLLDILADDRGSFEGRKRPRYFTFDTLRNEVEENYLFFWQDVITLHAQILGWVGQPSIYNKIGFLIHCGCAIREIIASSKRKRKSEFESYLIDKIKKTLNSSEDKIEDLSYERSKDHSELVKILLLMNIEAVTASKIRFPFSRHNEKQWSLEHIHAQSSETLNKAEQWKAWLTSHNIAAMAVHQNMQGKEASELRAKVDEAINEIENGIFSGTKFQQISLQLLNVLSKDVGADHTIRNLALLASEDNSRLSNSVFEVKRRMILELDQEGQYVPICTKNVFLKYYANADAHQPHFWSDTDKDSYFSEIKRRLKPYLLVSLGEEEIQND